MGGLMPDTQVPLYHLPLQHDTRPILRQAQRNAPEGAQNQCSNVPEEKKKGKVKAFTFLHPQELEELDELETGAI